jgi:hypothetical protein
LAKEKREKGKGKKSPLAFRLKHSVKNQLESRGREDVSLL